MRVFIYFLVVVATNCWARNESPGINVEILLFKQNPNLTTDENLNIEPPLLSSSDTILLEDLTAIKTPTTSKLTPTMNKIKNSRNYAFLDYFTWQQKPEDLSQTIYLSKNKQDQEIISGDSVTLEGKVKIKPIQQRNLYPLSLELRLELPEDGVPYRLVKNIKVKANEITYIDHPKFAAFICINTLEAIKSEGLDNQ